MATFQYDVYISYDDGTRTGFTGHLEKGFNEKGISISKDNPEAIETSRVSILVLSKDYPSSVDRLDELVKIVNTAGEILPVFYYVEPYHVGHLSGDYGDVFKSHQNSVSHQRYHRWIDVMELVAEVTGFHIQRGFGKDEAQYIEEIYQNVSNYLACTVGLHGRVLDLDAYELLCLKVFKSKLIKPSCVSITKRAAICASGHPLLLEVIGSNLCGKGEKEQKSTLDQYEKIHNEEIEEMLVVKRILQVSFESLEKCPREKLIHIADQYHLIENKSKKEVEDNLHAVFGGCPIEDMKALLDKSLIKINEDDQVTEHDLILDMVRGIDFYEDNADLTKLELSDHPLHLPSFGDALGCLLRSSALLPW